MAEIVSAFGVSIYNAYKSIVVKGGENVKGNLIRYMLNVINYEMSTVNEQVILLVLIILSPFKKILLS